MTAYLGFPCVCPSFCFCREPRGFGFVQYVDPADAADAKYHMDGQVLLGRELTVVFAEENRKKPNEMRTRERRYVLLLYLVMLPIMDLTLNELLWNTCACDLFAHKQR